MICYTSNKSRTSQSVWINFTASDIDMNGDVPLFHDNMDDEIFF